jgi:hypothetical protein
MRFKVVYEFHSSESMAKKALKKIPKLFSNPHISQLKDGGYAVIAGEYDRKDWAEAAVHKLYENKLWGGVYSSD